jgi:sporulation protein YlmC with PRC-barrel domain
MFEEISEIIGLEVYTDAGTLVGNVDNLVVDVDGCRIDGIFVAETNPLLVEDSRTQEVSPSHIVGLGQLAIL